MPAWRGWRRAADEQESQVQRLATFIIAPCVAETRGGVCRKYWLVYIGKEGQAAIASSFFAQLLQRLLFIDNFSIDCQSQNLYSRYAILALWPLLSPPPPPPLTFPSGWRRCCCELKVWANRARALSLHWTHPLCRTAPCALLIPGRRRLRPDLISCEIQWDENRRRGKLYELISASGWLLQQCGLH